MTERPSGIAFTPEAAAILRRSGWTVLGLPGGLTLSALRQQGAPFRGERYFTAFAPGVIETPTVAREIAYQPGVLRGSVNRRYAECLALVEEFNRTIPAGCWATIGSAAAYVYILWQHAQASGAFPLAGLYTWTSDVCPEGHLIVGVFGRQRPLVVAPHAKSGSGVGVMPLVVPAGGGGEEGG
jgi:hypothetical protein